MAATPGSRQEKINKLAPAASKAKLGDAIAELITAQNALAARASTAVITKAGLAIKAGASPIVKAVAAFVALIAGVPVRKGANTDMAALVGTLATAKSAAWAFYIDADGTLTTSAKTADADTHAAALALLPVTPAAKAMIGFIVVDNATGSNFVGGTTALDTGSLTVTYYDTIGPTVLASELAALTVKTLEVR